MLRALKLGAGLALMSVGAIVVMHVVQAPSPFLLGGLVGGAAFALAFRASWDLPDPVRQLGTAVVGVGAGTLLDSNVIHLIADAPVAVTLGIVVSLVFSLLTGVILLASASITMPTALLSSVAGAAIGVTAMARDLDADEAVVSTLQYARVVAIILSVTAVAPVLGDDGPVLAASPTADAGGTAVTLGLLFTVVCVAGGLLLTRVARFSGSTLVMPMLLAMGGTFVVDGPVHVPAPVLNLGYTIVGLSVGFSFTPATVRLLARLFPLAVLQLIANVGGCAIIGILFARAVGVSTLDGYLAMTPGGLVAVSAVAVETGADVSLVVTMQLIRLFAAILVAVVLGSILKRRADRRRSEPEPGTGLGQTR